MDIAINLRFVEDWGGSWPVCSMESYLLMIGGWGGAC